MELRDIEETRLERKYKQHIQRATEHLHQPQRWNMSWRGRWVTDDLNTAMG
jgi:hypothetical protein